MFENYPEYFHDVVTAAKNMPQRKKILTRKYMTACAASLLIAGGLGFAGNTAVANAQVREALDCVSADITNQTVLVQVEDSGDNSMAYLLSDRANNLSATDEAAISEQIKTSITDDSLAQAAGKVHDDGTIQVEIFTEDGVPVTVTIKKTDEGYSIDSIIAKLDQATADEKKKQISNAISTDAQKKANAYDLGSFEASFASIAGIEADASDDDKRGAYDSNMQVLADELLMALPKGYSSQETELVETGVDETAQATAEKPEEKLRADSVKPYALSFKDNNGSTISVRCENLGVAFTSMNGPDGANKMMGYWQETANNVAAGAGQSMKNPDQGFEAKLFYDEKSGMWGYFGHVEFTDGSRDVIYNRVVFVDELADQMITVSYRHDSVADANSAMSFDYFKSLFMHAPIKEDISAFAFSGNVVEDQEDENAAKPAKVDQIALDAYKSKLRQIQILPGQTMTEPEREVAEAARIAAEEEAMRQAEAAAQTEGEIAE